jgi:hypothetical protein
MTPGWALVIVAAIFVPYYVIGFYLEWKCEKYRQQFIEEEKRKETGKC